MRVLIASLHLTHAGGVANYVGLLLRNIQGHEMEQFVQGLPPRYHKSFVLPFVYAIQCLRFSARLNTFQPDLVHLNPSLTWASLIRDTVLLLIARRKGYRVLFFIRGWRWPLYERIKKTGPLRSLLSRALSSADLVLVLSKDFRDALVDLGIDGTRIAVSSTMVEARKYRVEGRTFAAPFRVLFCSQLHREKGPAELLEAVPAILQRHPDTQFVFVGGGRLVDDLRMMAKRMGIQRSVLFAGRQVGDAKREWYRKAHLFVLPSYTEGFPTVVLEAMAAGLPLVVTPVGALKHVLEHGKNGYILDRVPAQPGEISEKITKLLDSPERMQEISEHNMKEAGDRYDVEVVAAQIAGLYHTLCSSGAPH